MARKVKWVVIVCIIASIMYSASARTWSWDCKSSERDYGIEALCLYAERPALAGRSSDNPIAREAVINYVLDKGPVDDAVQVGSGKAGEYFARRIEKIHKCFDIEKNNICDRYHE